VLEAQLEILSVGERWDVELVSEVVHYLVSFHDRFHHPREKAASLHVAARVVSARPALAAIARQHAELEERGAALLLAIDGPSIDSEALRRALGADGFAYVALLRAHMLEEESTLFPLVERTLTDDEWAAIVARVGASDDPLWGASDHAGYAALYERLTKSAGCGCAYD
jgi:hemerythrin-like domain-containing protein